MSWGQGKTAAAIIGIKKTKSTCRNAMSRQPDEPLAHFTHCPRCGRNPLSRVGERGVRCAACGFLLYFNCAAAVAALLLHRGKLVLGVRGKEPGKGMLDLPGGFVEFGETAEEALRREVMEELNLSIPHPAYLGSAPNKYPYGGIVYRTTDLFFVCELEDISAIKAGDDVAEYRLADPALLDPQALAFPSSRAALARLLEWLGLPA
jgi:ADP-ribose pyrophosphatase YjhB (NUDIX family)